MDKFVSIINDPSGRTGCFLEELAALSEGRIPEGEFILNLAGSATSNIPGISAAGATPESRKLTPAVDAEVLLTGTTADGGSIPVSPAGIVSPVVITRAALALAGAGIGIVDCGTFKSPAVPYTRIHSQPARCLSTGQAMDRKQVMKLFSRGREAGSRIKKNLEYLILAECVPGGTTTAAAVLTAFGYQVRNLLSSSLPVADQELRFKLIDRGIKKAGLSPQIVSQEPLNAIAAVGDPMQPVVAAIALTAATDIPVILAGGSQMLAVWELVRRLAGMVGIEWQALNLAVITTKWVVYDSNAGTAELARMLDAPLAASCPDFSQSRHRGLKAYEDGHVKEGVGAGGAMAAASIIAGCSARLIMDQIDRGYEDVVRDGLQVESQSEMQL